MAVDDIGIQMKQKKLTKTYEYFKLNKLFGRHG